MLSNLIKDWSTSYDILIASTTVNSRNEHTFITSTIDGRLDLEAHIDRNNKGEEVNCSAKFYSLDSTITLNSVIEGYIVNSIKKNKNKKNIIEFYTYSLR